MGLGEIGGRLRNDWSLGTEWKQGGEAPRHVVV